ncbi:Myosin regulatory light chain 12B [Smittium culicis]|uniref:Myosin regulatory light chain 12B n=1 Tax=Smittium culicis TaxID=133412 RepID=A0A1R1YJX1_9FUNG|nr:Myosin regulatory light chain 12B [Smittium culicis]
MMAQKRSARNNSNAFSIFDQKQISELKEAFSIFDHDQDGIISREDLKDMLNSLGQDSSDSVISAMLAEANGPINFTMFLTMMSEKLVGIDSEHEINNAFEAFDEEGNGLISAKDFKEALMYMGDRMSASEVELIFRDIKVDHNGNVPYSVLAQKLKNGQ